MSHDKFTLAKSAPIHREVHRNRATITDHFAAKNCMERFFAPAPKG